MQFYVILYIVKKGVLNMDSIIGWVILCICFVTCIVCLIRKGLKEIDNNHGDDGVTKHRVRYR